MTEERANAIKKYWKKAKEQCPFTDETLVNGYLEGFIEGTIEATKENKVIWHDLRKNPKDLPKGHKVVLNQVGAQTTYDPGRGFLGFEGCGIRAWTDIPLFKD